jgi:hypothetical protein
MDTHAIVSRERTSNPKLVILECSCGFWQQRFEWDADSFFLRLDVNHAHAAWYRQHLKA